MVIGLSAVIATILGTVAFNHWRFGVPRVATSPAVAEGSPPKAVRIAECLERRPVKIAEDVYLLGDMRPSAVYVVETSDGLALIDAGLESAHDTLLDGMSALGLDVGRLKIILLTHAHGDHTMGAQRLRDETGAKVYIGREDAGPLRRGGPWEAVFSKFDIEGETLHPTTIDGELSDEQVIELGQARFTVVATPGHTPGSCCFLLEIEGQRLLFTGDAISTFTVGMGTYTTRLPPRYGGDVGRYLHSLEKLRRLPAPNLVLPGHPASDLAPPDPHFHGAEWTALVDRGVAELEKLSQRYARDGADFLDGSPKQILDGLYYLGDFEGHAAYAVVRGDSALLFDAARGPDAVQRLAVAWQRLGVSAPAISAVVLTSSEAENVTGLKSVVEAAGCRVIGPAEGLEAIAMVCPGATVVTAEELPALGWGGLLALPIAGVAQPQAAYRFRHGDAAVLVSGTMPIDADANEFAKLGRQSPPRDWDAQLLAGSLERLGEIKPDIWLSAAPWCGRNANLYDRAWANTLTWNQQLLRHWYAAH